MDLARTGFETPLVGTASFKVNLDANGYLLPDSSESPAAGSKRISYNNVKADADANAIEEIGLAFLSEIPGPSTKGTAPDTTETTFTVKWEAE